MSWLDRPLATRLVFVAGMLVALPSVAVGFFSDDYAILAELKHAWLDGPTWRDLYRFTASSDEGNRALIAGGFLPWWAAPALRFHFLRPLSSALLAADRALFGDVPLGWHLHSLVWWALLLLAVRALYQRLLPGGSGTVALAVFAFSPAHVQTYGWIASRHMVVAVAPAFLALLAHVRQRQDGWKPGGWLAPLLLATGLAGGEAALAGVTFWIAYEIAGPAALGDARRRLRAAAPAMAIAGTYLVVYKAVGGGTAASAGYVDPLHSPGAFAVAAAERFPALLANALIGVPAELSVFVRPLAFAAVAAGAAIGLGALWWWTRARIPDPERSNVRWLVLGAFAAMVIALGGYPGGRLLLGPDLGFAALIGATIRHAIAASPWPRRVAGGVLASVHLLAAPAVLLGAAVPAIALMARANEAIAGAVTAEVQGARRVFVVASDPMASVYVGAVLASEDTPPVGCWSWLSGAPADHRLTRVDPTTLSLEPVGSSFLRGPFEALYRAPQLLMKEGDEIEQCGARIRVASVEAGRPTRIEVRFPASPDDGDIALVAWDGRRLARVPPPRRPGEEVGLKHWPGPMGMY
jgi:hypothetical protein